MSTKPYDVIVPNEKRPSSSRFAHLFTLLTLSLLAACTPVIQETIVIEPPKEPEPVVIVSPYSDKPIIRAKTLDVRFAQQALTTIGYKIGPVDGLWGPRSAGAIREFEAKNELPSADGHLSERNLYELEAASGISRENYGKLMVDSPLGIKAKLDKKVPLSSGPQLIIVDREYKVLSKPNPYSSELLTLAIGTGIYVISKQDNYFEVESINRKRGYIRAD